MDTSTTIDQYSIPDCSPHFSKLRLVQMCRPQPMTLSKWQEKARYEMLSGIISSGKPGK